MKSKDHVKRAKEQKHQSRPSVNDSFVTAASAVTSSKYTATTAVADRNLSSNNNYSLKGDLLLMSLYERGTVPEVRQVAQMLQEVPHHV
jgi:hypothetical protein